MILKPIWLSAENTIEVYDSVFDAATDSFELLFVHEQLCSCIILNVTSVTVCEGIVKFVFNVACELKPGIYNLTLTNTTQSIIVCETKVVVYADKNCCNDC